ncbi:MAG: endo-1,4-beta-xylanase [Ignavibacteriaceae bacterium]
MYKNIFTLVCLILLVAGSGLTAQVDPRTENLIHAWTFDDESLTDSVGGVEGVLMGGAMISNGSLNTKIQESWLEIPGESIELNKYTGLTIEIWFKSVPNGNTDFNMLASFGNSPNALGSNYYFITPTRGDDVSRAAISIGDESTPWASETGANGIEVDDGNLHHMVSTLDEENITLYIDGQLQASTPLAENNSIAGISTNFAYLAKSLYDADPTWRGEIFEFNIYNKALASDEILFLFDESNIYADDRPVIVEAESGELGSYFSIMQDGEVTYITTTTNHTNIGSPDESNRVATYQVTFQDSGFYSLFVRLRVGSGSFNDDSFFYGRGFGEKDDTARVDWVFVNGFASSGFSDSSDIVYDLGTAGTGVWKWVNVTRNTYSDVLGDSFYVSLDSLTKTFQLASREDGLDFDKIAFGKSNLFYTVGNLQNGEPGVTEIPGPDTTNVWNGPPLAADQPKFVGNIHSPAQTANFEAYWNQVTPENAGKWGSVEYTRDVMNWGGLDAAYKLAKDNGFPFHFHVLIWGAQQPPWINSLSAEEQLEEIREWFEAVAERYPDIDYLEVVNEPLQGHNPPDGGNGRANYREALGGSGESGWEWVLNSFRMAREIFPEGTRLMLNDFSIINSPSSTATYLNIIRLLKAEGLIDIIGEQGHAFTTIATIAMMKRNLDSLASTGIPIQITELDIDGTGDQVQLQSYQRIFPALYEHPGVEGITLWGWRRGLWRDDEGAYLVNQDGSERPSLIWLREYLDSVNVNPVSVEDVAEVPDDFYLYNNYPNPFNPETKISFNLPYQSDVRILLIDALGRVVKEIVSGNFSSGLHNVTLNASNLSSGVYFYKIEAGSFIDVKKLVLMK